MKKWGLIFSFAALLGLSLISRRGEAQQAAGNRVERLDRFRGMGFGLFIHWSLYRQIGSAISHSLAGVFSATATKLQPGLEYEYRAFAKHPVLTLHGAEKPFSAAK